MVTRGPCLQEGKKCNRLNANTAGRFSHPPPPQSRCPKHPGRVAERLGTMNRNHKGHIKSSSSHRTGCIAQSVRRLNKLTKSNKDSLPE